MPLASDEAVARELAEQAARIEVNPARKIEVTPPASRSQKSAPPRRLKEGHGGVLSVEVVKGLPPSPPQPRKPLTNSPPPPSKSGPNDPGSKGPVEYDTRDLEQRGWEVLADILNNSGDQQIVDFRARHQVGADGAIDWKKFVELKATGRGPQSSVEFPASEFERAKQRGLDFVLALVSGLEEGLNTEVRLIFDPANRVSVTPLGTVRLSGLTDAPSVVIRIADLNGSAEIAA
jgi:hypothetical protein